MAQDDQGEKRQHFASGRVILTLLSFHPRMILLFSTVKELYYILGLKKKKKTCWLRRHTKTIIFLLPNKVF